MKMNTNSKSKNKLYENEQKNRSLALSILESLNSKVEERARNLELKMKEVASTFELYDQTKVEKILYFIISIGPEVYAQHAYHLSGMHSDLQLNEKIRALKTVRSLVICFSKAYEIAEENAIIEFLDSSIILIDSQNKKDSKIIGKGQLKYTLVYEKLSAIINLLISYGAKDYLAIEVTAELHNRYYPNFKIKEISLRSAYYKLKRLNANEWKQSYKF